MRISLDCLQFFLFLRKSMIQTRRLFALHASRVGRSAAPRDSPASIAVQVRQLLVSHTCNGTAGVSRKAIDQQFSLLTSSTTTSPAAALLWEAASTLCYRRLASTLSQDDLIVFLDWELVLRDVAASLPFEGVLERAFVDRLRAHCPTDMSEDVVASLVVAPGTTLGHWLHRHFASLVLVTVSAVSGEAIYYDQSRNVVRGATVRRISSDHSAGALTVAALHNALRILGRGKELPVWTNFSDVAPLLPAPARPDACRWAEFFTQRDVADAFEVERRVAVRWAGHYPAICVIVDATSLTGDQSEALLRSLSLPKSSYTMKLMCRNSPEPHAWWRGRLEVEEVPVSAVLDPEHVLGALITSVAETYKASVEAQEGLLGLKVYFLCADEKKETFAEVAGQVDCLSTTVELVTPASLRS